MTNEVKKYYWHGSGVLPYKGVLIKKGDEVPAGAISSDRLVHFIKIGKISDMEVSGSVSSQERLLSKISELEADIKKHDNSDVKKALVAQKSENVKLAETIKTLQEEYYVVKEILKLPSVKAAAEKEAKPGLFKKIFGK